jgi:hypothetical protein
LVFVLLLHRAQLQEAIKGVYGQGVDATQYLAKFVHFFMTLPKSRRTDASGRDTLNAFCKGLEQKHGFVADRETNDFSETFATLSRLLELSLRDIEKGYIVAALANDFSGTPAIMAWVIALKVKYPEIFLGVLDNRPESSIAAKKILSKFLHLSGEHDWLLALSELHTAVERGNSDDFSVESQRVFGWSNGRGSEKRLKHYAAKVDLAV